MQKTYAIPVVALVGLLAVVTASKNLTAQASWFQGMWGNPPAAVQPEMPSDPTWMHPTDPMATSPVPAAGPSGKFMPEPVGVPTANPFAGVRADEQTQAAPTYVPAVYVAPEMPTDIRGTNANESTVSTAVTSRGQNTEALCACQCRDPNPPAGETADLYRHPRPANMWTFPARDDCRFYQTARPDYDPYCYGMRRGSDVGIRGSYGGCRMITNQI